MSWTKAVSNVIKSQIATTIGNKLMSSFASGGSTKKLAAKLASKSRLDIDNSPTNHFSAQNDPFKYDLLYYGAHFLPVYPLRDKIYKVLKKLQSNNNYNIKIIEHVSYNKNVFKLPMDEELCLLINQSRFCISTSSIYDILVKKYIEIPLCGTTTIGNIPSKYKNQLSGKMRIFQNI